MYRFDGSTVLVIKTDVTHTVTHQTTHILPPAGTQNALGESHKKASTQQASRSSDRRARSMPASALRTLWTVAKPKTPMVAVRWRERRRSRPHHSRRRPNLTRNNPTQPQPNPTRNNPTQSTILKLGPRPALFGRGFAPAPAVSLSSSARPYVPTPFSKAASAHLSPPPTTDPKPPLGLSLIHI